MLGSVKFPEQNQYVVEIKSRENSMYSILVKNDGTELPENIKKIQNQDISDSSKKRQIRKLVTKKLKSSEMHMDFWENALKAINFRQHKGGSVFIRSIDRERMDSSLQRHWHRAGYWLRKVFGLFQVNLDVPVHGVFIEKDTGPKEEKVVSRVRQTNGGVNCVYEFKGLPEPDKDSKEPPVDLAQYLAAELQKANEEVTKDQKLLLEAPSSLVPELLEDGYEPCLLANKKFKVNKTQADSILQFLKQVPVNNLMNDIKQLELLHQKLLANKDVENLVARLRANESDTINKNDVLTLGKVALVEPDLVKNVLDTLNMYEPLFKSSKNVLNTLKIQLESKKIKPSELFTEDEEKAVLKEFFTDNNTVNQIITLSRLLNRPEDEITKLTKFTNEYWQGRNISNLEKMFIWSKIDGKELKQNPERRWENLFELKNLQMKPLLKIGEKKLMKELADFDAYGQLQKSAQLNQKIIQPILENAAYIKEFLLFNFDDLKQLEDIPEALEAMDGVVVDKPQFDKVLNILKDNPESLTLQELANVSATPIIFDIPESVLSKKPEPLDVSA